MPPVDRRNPIRAASSESTCNVLEFFREFPDDEACLHISGASASRLTASTPLPALRSGQGVQEVRDRAEAAVLVLPDLRPPDPSAGRNDLRAVVHVASDVVLRHVPHG